MNIGCGFLFFALTNYYMNANAQDIPGKPFDAEDYDIFGYSVNVTFCADATVLPQDIRLLCLGKEKKKYSSFTILHFPKSVVFTYYQAHDFMIITASLNILKSLLTHQ